MKRMMKRLLPVLMAIAPLTICAQKVYELKDISGKVQVNVIVNDKNVEYSVLHDNDVMVAPSPIFMKLTDGTAFGLNPKVKKISRRSVNETIYPPIYKKKSIKDQFNELTIDFKGGYSLVFRAYEDGAAYRFVSELKKPFMVESEQASFCFPNDPKVFVASPKGRMNEGKKDPFYSSFQNTEVFGEYANRFIVGFLFGLGGKFCFNGRLEQPFVSIRRGFAYLPATFVVATYELAFQTFDAGLVVGIDRHFQQPFRLCPADGEQTVGRATFQWLGEIEIIAVFRCFFLFSFD